jgi:hypothetical protein
MLAHLGFDLSLSTPSGRYQKALNRSFLVDSVVQPVAHFRLDIVFPSFSAGQPGPSP